MPKKEQTARIVKAISHPAVHILGHPTGRLLNVREPCDVDLDEVLLAAKEHHVAVELNANPERLDLSDVQVFRARELGVPVVISTDAHSVENLHVMRYGVDQARRGWLEKKDVLNTKTLTQLRRWLEKK
jgi:DNA polymerase (family 10)